MNENQPDSFYLVCIEKPKTAESQPWNGWFAFCSMIKDDPKLTETSKALSDSLFLFPARSGVLPLSRFLAACEMAHRNPKVFFLENEPMLCE